MPIWGDMGGKAVSGGFAGPEVWGGSAGGVKTLENGAVWPVWATAVGLACFLWGESRRISVEIALGLVPGEVGWDPGDEQRGVDRDSGCGGE